MSEVFPIPNNQGIWFTFQTILDCCYSSPGFQSNVILLLCGLYMYHFKAVHYMLIMKTNIKQPLWYMHLQLMF